MQSGRNHKNDVLRVLFCFFLSAKLKSNFSQLSIFRSYEWHLQPFSVRIPAASAGLDSLTHLGVVRGHSTHLENLVFSTFTK